MVHTARMTLQMTHGVTCGLMVEQGDWALVRQVIDAETAFQGRTQTELCEAAGIDRTALQHMTKGRPPSDATLRRIEGALALPREFLLYVAHKDYGAMEQTDASPDLIRFVKRRATEIRDATNAS